jgi:hypothetical protein
MGRDEIRMKWETHIKAFRASGQKATHWCKANHINRRQLYAWMKKLDGSSSAPPKRTAFIPVQVTPETKPGSSSCLRIRIGVAVIEVDAGFEPVLLRNVVRALEGDTLC